MMKMLPAAKGRSEKGCNSWVPYTVIVSSSGWVINASHSARHQRQNSSRCPCKCDTIHDSTGAPSVSQNSAWLCERCSVMLRMASP